MSVNLKIGLFLFFVFFSYPFENAICCPAIPPEEYTPYTDLIHGTTRIALGSLQNSKVLQDGSREYLFKTTKVVKGSVGETFTVVDVDIGVAISSENNSDYEGHTKKEFWENPYFGRGQSFIDCKIHPVFNQGDQYLIFLDKPYHWKSFERVATLQDKWFVEVSTVVSVAKEYPLVVQAELNSVINPATALCGGIAVVEKRKYKLLKQERGSLTPDKRGNFIAYVMCPEMHPRAELHNQYTLYLAPAASAPCQKWFGKVPPNANEYCVGHTIKVF